MSDSATIAGDPVEERLQRTGQLIRTLYCLQYRRFEERRVGRPSSYGNKPIKQWDGGTDSAGRTFKPVWPKIARYLVANGADPEYFVDAQFEQRGLLTAPYPNTFLSPRALENYRRYVHERGEDLRRTLQVQHDQLLLEIGRLTAIQRMRDDQAGLFALADPTANLSALYRYATAVLIGARDLAARFHANALDQYFYKASAYDEAWGDFVPDELRTEAAELRAKLLADEVTSRGR